MPETHLQIGDLHAQYGESQVLHGMALTVGRGEVVTLLGRNGAGKTTTLRAIMGLLARRSGSVRFEARELMGLAPEAIARAGIALCPEERAIFSGLSVQENLMLPPVVRAGGMTVPEILALFPNLAERLKSPGTKLSGGEQQMLAIARALMARPRLLLLDEPSLGLAPQLVDDMFRIIRQINANGTTILLVEQNVALALDAASYGYVMETGAITLAGPAAELAHSEAIRASYL